MSNYYIEGSDSWPFGLDTLSASGELFPSQTDSNLFIGYFGFPTNPIEIGHSFKIWSGLDVNLNVWYGAGTNNVAVLRSVPIGNWGISPNTQVTAKITFNQNTKVYSIAGTPSAESINFVSNNSSIIENVPSAQNNALINLYYNGWHWEKDFTFNSNGIVNFKIVTSSGFFYGGDSLNGIAILNGDFIPLDVSSGITYRFRAKPFAANLNNGPELPYEIINLSLNSSSSSESNSSSSESNSSSSESNSSSSESNSSSSSAECPTRKLHVWFETFTVPDQLIIYGSTGDEELPEECSDPTSSSSSSSSNVLLDTELISTQGWKYYCVEVPPNIVQYKYQVYAPTPGTAWLIDIQSTCDSIPCSSTPNGPPPNISISSSSSSSDSSSSSSNNLSNCISPPINIDTNSECYERTINLDNYCCDINWDNLCDALYSFCNNECPSVCFGGTNSSSSSLSSSSSSSSSSTSPNLTNTIKIKQAQFSYDFQGVQRSIDKIPGYGSGNLNFSNILITGFIQNPTGYLPAISYETGLLNGIISGDVGSFTWENITISGTGSQGKVFVNTVTGFTNASGMIIFNNDLMTEGDYITINDIRFDYVTGFPTSEFEFNNANYLANILNSGATGAFSFALQFLVGVTGYAQNSNLILFAHYLSGEQGNNVKIARFSNNNIEGIKIPHRYFQGGESLRPVMNSWFGNFSNTFPSLTVENSGVYIQKIGPIQTFQNLEDIAWVDNFDKNYSIRTGFKDPINPGAYSGTEILFNSNLDVFSGYARIPVNLTNIYTGLNIEIFKPNPYNILGNVAEYIVSGNNFIFKDYIEG